MTVNDAPDFQQPSLHMHDNVAQQQHQLVLVGCDSAHLQVLASLAAHPLEGVKVVLVSPNKHHFHWAMLPGFVAGHYALEDCTIPLEPLIRQANVHWIEHSILALDPRQQLLTLDDGSTLTYDWLSINSPAVQNHEKIGLQIPGAHEHGRFIRPIENFVADWTRLMDKSAARAQRIAVIGAGPTGVELACAIRYRLPKAAVTLVAGSTLPVADYPEPAQEMVHKVLKKKGVTVLQDVVTTIGADEVRLGCGASLACDVPLLAVGAQPPQWIEHSGLTLDERGYIAVNEYQQSVSHSHIFASGEGCVRTNLKLARSGAYAMHVASNLRHNLNAVISGAKLKSYARPHSAFNTLSCGGRYAIANWREYSVQGHWVWWLKNSMDRRFVARFKTGK